MISHVSYGGKHNNNNYQLMVGRTVLMNQLWTTGANLYIPDTSRTRQDIYQPRLVNQLSKQFREAEMMNTINKTTEQLHCTSLITDISIIFAVCRGYLLVVSDKNIHQQLAGSNRRNGWSSICVLWCMSRSTNEVNEYLACTQLNIWYHLVILLHIDHTNWHNYGHET